MSVCKECGQEVPVEKQKIRPMRFFVPSDEELEFPEETKFGTGWLLGKIHGQPAYSNGHFMLVGKPPTGQPKAEKGPDFEKVIAKEAGKSALQAVRPVVFGKTPSGYRKEEVSVVWFENGTAVNGAYFSHIIKRYPGAEFQAAGLDDCLLIYNGREMVGALMPMRSEALGVKPEEALAARDK